MGGGSNAMRRIPLIKFPQRHPKPSVPLQQVPSQLAEGQEDTVLKSDVPASPRNTAVGGMASLQPKRTPVSNDEIEAILLGGSF